MSTLQDFLDAPFGATATQEETRARAFRLHREFGETWIVAEMDGTFDTFESEELVDGGFILDPSPAPSTAREALDLAWELAHPVKEGQTIPEGTWVLHADLDDDGAMEVYKTGPGILAPHKEVGVVRTLDPLPDPEPDWLDADAVIAFKDAVVDVWTHCTSHPHKDGSGWTRRNPDSCTHWTELEHVTPLYPKGQEA